MMSQTYENQKMDTHFLPLFWFQVTILGLEFVVHEAINRGRGEGTSCSIYSQHHNLLTVPTFAFLLPHIFRLSGLPKEKQGEEVIEELLLKSKVTFREKRRKGRFLIQYQVLCFFVFYIKNFKVKIQNQIKSYCKKSHLNFSFSCFCYCELFWRGRLRSKSGKASTER